MKCVKCGKECQSGSAFCPNCGAPLLRGDAGSKKIPNKKIIGVAVGIIVILLLGILIFKPKYKKIVLADYIEYEIEGKNGNAYANFGLNTSKIITDLSNYDEDFEFYLEELSYEIQIKPNKDENLQNGDKIKIICEVPEQLIQRGKDQFKVKLITKDKTIKVEGLEEAQEIDPFEYVDLECYGTVEDGVEVEIVTKDDCPFETFDYFGVQDGYYDDGDKIKVVFNTEGYEDDYIIKNDAKEFTVKASDKYITTLGDLSEDDFGSLKTSGEESIKQYLDEKREYSNCFTYSKIKYEKPYLLVNDSGEYYNHNKNILYLIYSTKISSEKGNFGTKTVYFPVYYYDVIIMGALKTENSDNKERKLISNEMSGIYDESPELFDMSEDDYGLDYLYGYLSIEKFYDDHIKAMQEEEYPYTLTYFINDGAYVDATNSTPSKNKESKEDTSKDKEESKEDKASDELMELAKERGFEKEAGTEFGQYKGHIYAIFNFKEDIGIESFEYAEEYCEDIGGHLAIINSKEENDYIFSFLKENGKKMAFFGYADDNPWAMGEWTWVWDQSNTYENWDTNGSQPNNSTGNEHYAQFSKTGDGTWNDAEWGKGSYRMICEWEEEN